MNDFINFSSLGESNETGIKISWLQNKQKNELW